MCTNTTQYHYMEYANDLFTVLCGVTSVLLNTLVLYIAVRYVDFHIKLNQVYVVNMTVSDLLYGLVYMSTKQLVACFPNWLCACYYILVWASQIGSVFFLLFLNIDKFISLSAPLHYHLYVTERRVRWLWIVFWVIPLLYSAVTYFGPWITVPNSQVPCKILLNPIYYASTIIVFYIVPLTISTSISVYIYLLAHKKTHWTSHSLEYQTGEKKRARKQLVKRVFFVFFSTLWSTITILPYRLAYCIYTFTCVSVTYYSTSSKSANDSIAVTSSSIDRVTMAHSASSSFVSPHLSSNVTASGMFADDDQGQGEIGYLSSMCSSEAVSVLIYVLFCLPPLGAVGNPIITIVTQRFYRSRAGRIWISCMEALHAPKYLKCDTCDTSSHHSPTKLSQKANGTPVRRSNASASVLVTCRQGSKGGDTAVETIRANKAFQVL